MSAVASVWSDLADAIKEAAGQMITTLFGWWTTTSSLNMNAPPVHAAQSYVIAWIAVPIAVLALLASITWGVLGGGTQWIADVVRGLLVFGVVAAGSIPIVAGLQTWSAVLAEGLLSAVPAKDVGGRIIGLLAIPGAGFLIVIFWGLVLLIAAAVQYVIMLFRDGAILVLTAVLPIAAAGQFNRGSLLWLPKVVGWMLAFVFVKPAAALIYYLGLNLLGEAQGIQALATAFCLLVAATFALPALLKLVTFALEAPQIRSGALAAGAAATGIAASAAQISARPRAGSAPSGAAPPSRPSGPPGAGPNGGPSGGGGAAGAGAAAAVTAASTARAVANKGVRPTGSTS